MSNALNNIETNALPVKQPPLKKTPLNAVHRALGGKMVDFAGYDMPVEYSGVMSEHKAVRQQAGIFDVSHMGEIEVSGPQALALVQHVTINDASKLVDGQAQYSALLYEHGGFVDDILVHRVNAESYFLCVNASNQDKDFQHIHDHNLVGAKVENAGPRYSQIAVQGPLATGIVQKLTALDLSSIKRYHFADGKVAGVDSRCARTGYTGEDGWELYVANDAAVPVWQKLMEAGKDVGLVPCGLGARNTLRLEAAMPLYGHEIDASINAWEAGLDWVVKLHKGDFVGRDALLSAREQGVKRKLIGFEMTERGIARDGCEIVVDGTGVGWVTSGGPSPSTNKIIGMCYLPVEIAVPEKNIEISVRGRSVAAVTVALPFYKRAK